MNKPTDTEITRRAVELLAEGLLVSFLPTFLVREFSITPEHARRLCIQALKQRERPADG